MSTKTCIVFVCLVVMITWVDVAQGQNGTSSTTVEVTEPAAVPSSTTTSTQGPGQTQGGQQTNAPDTTKTTSTENNNPTVPGGGNTNPTVPGEGENNSTLGGNNTISTTVLTTTSGSKCFENSTFQIALLCFLQAIFLKAF
uniref:mucin-5AC-like isoform X1 n=1 Tax=Styela clava TaxID=7725 RepID=UPI001939F08B|nr:mucin-5AC-like isoform X1 [Styela clava]